MTRLERFNMPVEFRQMLIGMDRMFDDAFACQSQKYPPVNIYEDGEQICIEMAVAGFNKKELSIHLSPDNTLSVKGKKELTEEQKEKEYIHRGLSSRSFEKKFTLNRDLEVFKSTCEDGILKIFITNIPHKDDTVIDIE